MIVFSDALVLARSLTYVPDLPVIGYENRVTVSNVAADDEDADHPITNVANPATYLYWQGANTTDKYVTVSLSGTDAVNYLGIARHNLGSGEVLLTVQGITGEPGAVWEDLLTSQYLADDEPAMFIFEDAYLVGIRLKLEPDATIPEIAVIYTGATLTLMHSVPAGHTPLKYGREQQMLNAVAQNGNFLGNIVTAETRTTTFEVRVLDGDWYWSVMQPFIDVCRDPFFLAWRPDTRPTDVSYAWATANPRPVISQLTGEVDISMQLAGLAI